jgi:hypothetical protein
MLTGGQYFYLKVDLAPTAFDSEYCPPKVTSEGAAIDLRLTSII